MKRVTGLKSMDLTEVKNNNSNKKINVEPNSKALLPKNKTPKPQITRFEEDSVISHSSRSVFVRNRENSMQTYQKYLKMLDPSFLKDDENLDYQNSELFYQNSHVPQKILKLLPINRNKSDFTLKSLSSKIKEASRKKFILDDISAKIPDKNDESQISSSRNPLKVPEIVEM